MGQDLAMHIVRLNVLGERSIAGRFKNVSIAQVYGIMYRMALREQERVNAAGLKVLVGHFNKDAYERGRAEVHLVDKRGRVITRFSQVWPMACKQVRPARQLLLTE